MSRTLFEEAIADAKQLREAAEQNAKNAIIEAVTPRIREFIENQLVGQGSINENADFLQSALSEGDEEEESDEEEVELDESALRSLVGLMRNSSDRSGAEISNNDALTEAFSSLTEEEKSNLLNLIHKEDESEDEEITADGAYEIDLDELKATIVSEIETPKAPPHGDKKMMKGMKHEEDDLYELDEMMDDEEEDLDEADLVFSKEELESLGISADALKSLQFGVMVAGEEGEEEGEIEVSEPPEGAESAPEEEEEEEEEGDKMAETVYEIDENMLRRELARLREAKSKKKGSSSSSHKVAAAAFGGGTLEGDVLDVDINKGAGMKAKMMKEARENRALKQQLNDYRGAVETLREQLSDLNLFNAKLLYVNKIIKNKDVAPNQRRAIIEALDGASNLREAKLLYESLATSISSKNESLNESVKHTAGLASRPVTSSSARISGAGEVDRWATLAGLK